MGFWDWFTGRPTSPEKYREAVLPALQRAHPALGFGPGETAYDVAGRRPDGAQVLVSLRSFYSRLERGHDALDESERRVLEFVGKLLAGGPSFTRDELLAGVKPLLLPRGAFEAQQAGDLIRRPIRNPNFDRIYGYDAGPHVAWVNERHLATLEVSRDELDAAAERNLAACSTERDGEVSMLTAPGDVFLGHLFGFRDGLASSRVFCERFREFLASCFGDEGYRFAVPSRHVLVAIRARYIPDGGFMRQWFDTSPHPLSPDLHDTESFLAAA